MAKTIVASRFGSTAFWTSFWITGLLFPLLSNASDVVFDSKSFENETIGESPKGWTPFHRSSRPNVKIIEIEGRKCLRGARSSSGGWTSLAKVFDREVERVSIEFSFAFSKSDQRTLNIWTHEPHGRDASQFNLCIQQGSLMQYDGVTRSWRTITRHVSPSTDPEQPIWHRLRAIVDQQADTIDFWVSAPGEKALPEKPITRRAYRSQLPIGALDFVSGTRITANGWYLIDDLVIRSGNDIPAPSPLKDNRIELWAGEKIPPDPKSIPFVDGVEHQTIHRADAAGYRFLHGAAIVHHEGVFYANWANSPTNENGPHETLQGRRSSDGGRTWSELEVIGPGFEGEDRHSHGVLFVHNNEVWTICSRFGVGTPGKRFPGLKAEAFVLNRSTNRWQSRGIVMENCWPYDQPVQMGNGNFITGGQDRNGHPVVAVSHGNDLTKWDSHLIPFQPELKPSFAETTVWAEGDNVLAIIRGGEGVAWVSKSRDGGKNWSIAAPSNFPMPRAKAYLGRLSTGQLYLVSNLVNRDTLVISVGQPGKMELSNIWRLRHGKSIPPRFPGHAKSKQWSYPYAYEHEGTLYIVYSIGKEDCGLTTVPIDSLRANDES